MNVGLVIPIFNLCKNRLRNLAFNLNHLSTTDLVRDVIVLEQYSEHSNSLEVVDRFPNVNHIVFDLGKKTFNKSKLLNRYAETTKYDFIWMLDVDVYIDINYVLSQLPPNVKLVRPFELIQSLNKKETEHLFKTNLISITESKRETNNAFGKYSFIIETNLLNVIGGYDEDYEGWGFQDLDLIKRIPPKTYRGYTKNIAFHLFHHKASREKYNKNKSIFHKKGNFKKLVPRKKKILDKS